MLWIRNAAYIVTVDEQRRIVKNGSIIVSGSTIHDIGKDAEIRQKYGGQIAPGDVIDGSRCAVLPGLVNTHAHTFEHLSRGLFPDRLASRPWSYEYFLPFQAVLTEEEAYLSATMACLDMLKVGTTCFIDSSMLVSNKHLDSAVQAISDSGIRAFVGRGVCDKRPTDLPASFRPEWAERVFGLSTERALGEMEDVLKRWASRPSGRVRAWATIYGWLSFSTDQLFLGAKRLADRYGVGTEYHITTYIEEARDIEREHGVWPITYLDRLGALGSNVLLIHVIAIKDHEVDLLASHGTKVAHCPGTAFRLAKGAAVMGKMPEMLAKGVTVALGADGVCSCGTFDITRQMFLAAGLFKDARMDPAMIPAEQALEMGTINGARALLSEREFGSIEVGKKADLILFDMDRPEWVPAHDVVRTLVYSATGDSVKTMIVDGQVVMRNRMLQTLDERKVLDQAREAGERIAARAGLEPRSAWPVV
jgi:cytosine/adenosine deaminase-related metal-dependent hydrolase